MLPLYVDSHCHLDRYPDPAAALAEAERARVVIVAVSETPAGFESQRATFPESKFLRLAVGMHPLLVARLRNREVERFFSLARQVDYIGEVGIDLSAEGRPTRRRQIAVFERILGDPAIEGKVLTVHSRGAPRETVERLVASNAKAILHWYSGPLGLVDQALTAGLYFSINSPMTRSKSGRRLLNHLPRDRVLTETDGPYAKHQRRPSRPSDVPEIVTALARLWRSTVESVADQIAQNMARLYAVPSEPEGSGGKMMIEARGPLR